MRCQAVGYYKGIPASMARAKAFSGIIMTDWTTTINGAEAWKCIQVGNDLIMPGMLHDHKNIQEARKDGRLSREKLQICAERIASMANQRK